MPQKSGEMQAIVTRMKQLFAEHGQAREDGDDEVADGAFKAFMEQVDALIEQTIADIPPKVVEKVREVHIPAPLQGEVPPQMAPTPAPKGVQKYIPAFLRK